jgi:DNA helicase HerA-like ATPase
MLPEAQRFNYILSIFGRKGSGKSYLAKEIARDEKRIIAIDSLGEYDDLEVITDFRACVNALVEAEHKPAFKLALRTYSLDDDLQLIDLVFRMNHVTLLVEETSRYVSSAYLPQPFEQLVRYGRHSAINQIYLARRPSEIHRDLTAQSDVIVSFVQHERRDVEYLRSFMGDKANGVMNLGQYEALVYGEDIKMPWAIVQRKYLGLDKPGRGMVGDDSGDGVGAREHPAPLADSPTPNPTIERGTK